MNYKSSITVGTVTGLATGILCYAVSSPSKKNRMKKHAGKALKSAGCLIEDIKSVIM